MIDEDGYRPNVGIVLCNQGDQVFWARRCGHDAWQFPQGGIDPSEAPEQALFRELWEEVGLTADDVDVIGRTRGWLRYDIPRRYRRGQDDSVFRGQKQIWFLLRLVGTEEKVRFDVSDKPEFDAWRWVDYWLPAGEVIEFKRGVYRQALAELEPMLNERLRRDGGKTP